MFFATLVKVASAQNINSPAYSKLVQKADSFYNAKAYKESAFTYSTAFKLNECKGSTDDRYNAACSWALANYPDSAFSTLNQIAVNGSYSNYDHIIKDSDLSALKSDNRWQQLIVLVKANQDKAEVKFNKPLVAELKVVFNDDQSGRRKLDSVGKKFGFESKQIDELWNDIGKKDSVNLIKVQSILDKYGWLGPDVVSNRGSITLFIVIQHADQQVQEKYLPMMRDAVKKGNARPADLALLEDRVALEEGKKQIYGSQIALDPKTGKNSIRPIEDEPNVNKRRAAVGLEPLEEYAKQYGINYKLPTE